MRRLILFSALGALTLAAIHGCGNASPPPQAGDTVTPILTSSTPWKPGAPANLTVRLQATGKDGTKRPLDFTGISNDPVARVVFYEGSNKLSSAEVTLSHRC